jgi:CRISPR system Cascade subunit CasC
MKALLELHVLQNFAPSNLNRDDTGSPKDAIFGGSRRARISSQSLKRAMRMFVREHGLLEVEHLAERSKRFADEIADRLVRAGKDRAVVGAVVALALGGVGLKLKDDGKTEYLVFLGQAELNHIAKLIEEHWDQLEAAVNAQQPVGGAKAKDAKKAAKGAVPEDVRKQLEKTIRNRKEGGDAVDVALFGRMLADMPEKNQDAACQVAHAISTHKVDREFDFYTAVDDLKPEDNAGADMLGTVEFNSACYYRYAVIDLAQLQHNLQGDTELVFRGLEAFVRAAILSAPSGKQNTFAAHNPPSFVALTVRRDASPRSLTNAFEKPARATVQRSLTEASLEQLQAEWQKLDSFYGERGETVLWNGTSLDVTLGDTASNVAELIALTVSRARSALGV